MPLKTELESMVGNIFADRWEIATGTSIPEPADLLLGSNHGIMLDATVLYADIDGSTALVDAESAPFAAEIYKAYLHCASKVIKSCGGVITAYDGDRVMGIFIGNSKNTNAVDAALKINWARIKIVNPKLAAQYPGTRYRVDHAIGIDTSEIMAARIGVRKDNDIVWVGRAANYAAKLCAADLSGPIRITRAVFNRLRDSERFSSGSSLWNSSMWREQGNQAIFTSTWMRSIN